MQRTLMLLCLVGISILTIGNTTVGWMAPDNDIPTRGVVEGEDQHLETLKQKSSLPPVNYKNTTTDHNLPAIPRLSCDEKTSIRNMNNEEYCSRLNDSIWDELTGNPILKRLMASDDLKKRLIKHHQLQQRIASGDEPAGQRYLIWSLSGGIGNRLQAMVSSFLAALLSDRVFLLKDWFQNTPKKGVKTKKRYSTTTGLLLEDIMNYVPAKIHNNELLCSPFGIIHLSDFRIKYPHYFVESFSDAHVKVDIISKHDSQRQHWTNLTCGPASSLGSNAKFTYVWANQYYNPVFYMNKKTSSVMELLFPNGDVFGPLSRFLVRPNTGVEGLVEKFLCTHGLLPSTDETDSALSPQLTGDDSKQKVVGLQIRAFRIGKMTEMAMEFDFCLKSSKLSKIINQSSTKFFLATLHEPIRNYYSSKYPGRILSLEDQARGEQSTGSLPMDREAMADMLILGRTSDYLVSPGSTFGSFTTGYFSRHPVQVHTMESRSCSRMQSFQPCFMSMLKGDKILNRLQSGDMKCADGFIDVANGHKQLVMNCAPHYSTPFKK